MASSIGIRALEQCRVSPPPGSVPNSSLLLTLFDAIWLHSGSVQRLFFFPSPHPTTHFVHSFLPALKSSLSLALRHFYPLAGKVVPIPGSDGCFELRYVDGDSVAFTLAESDGDFDVLSGNGVRYASESRPLVPELDRESGDDAEAKPLLAVQVSVFPNSGICVGTVIRHVACDGSSSMQFMRCWASACLPGGQLSSAPALVYDRTLFANLEEQYSFIHQVIRKTKKFPVKQKACDGSQKIVCATKLLTRAEIKKIKQWVSAKVGNANPPIRLSTFVAACAFVWVCLQRSRANSDNDDEITQFGFVVDCRARLRPPIPANYFGNCLGFCVAEAKVVEITGDRGVVVASAAIAEAIQRYEEEKVWMKSPDQLKVRARIITVAGSPRLAVYETDFGWGRPIKAEVASIQKNGAISLAESREEQGGVEIGVAIPETEMDGFQSYFAQGIQKLEVA